MQKKSHSKKYEVKDDLKYNVHILASLFNSPISKM